MTYDELISLLDNAGANVRCDDLKTWLETVGFTVRKGGNGTHHIFTHNGLAEFYSSSFDCGHGRNSEVKRGYIRRVQRVIKNYKNELKQFLGENNGA